MENFDVYRKEVTHMAFENSDRPLKEEKNGDFLIAKNSGLSGCGQRWTFMVLRSS